MFAGGAAGDVEGVSGLGVGVDTMDRRVVTWTDARVAGGRNWLSSLAPQRPAAPQNSTDAVQDVVSFVFVTADPTLYQILGVDSNASRDSLKRAWRRKLLQVHPDHGGSAAEVVEVMEAFRVLSNPTQRAAYDATLPSSQPQSEQDESSWSNPTWRAATDHSSAEDDRDTEGTSFDPYEFLEGLSPELRAAFNRVEEIEREGGPDRRARIAAVWREYETKNRRDHAARRNAVGWFTCAGLTKQGLPCLSRVKRSGDYCNAHRQQEPATVSRSAHRPPSPSTESATAKPAPPPASGSEAAIGCLMLVGLVILIVWLVVRH